MASGICKPLIGLDYSNWGRFTSVNSQLARRFLIGYQQKQQKTVQVISFRKNTTFGAVLGIYQSLE